MNLTQLNDQRLHQELKSLVGKERALITRILHHLREVERRRLYSDFNRSSLFDYCVYELGYAGSQAHRRIQTMRLIKEIPQVEEKIRTGELSVSNVAQAQTLFNKIRKSDETPTLDKKGKIDVLKKLKNQSTREAQRTLVNMFPEAVPTERERAVSDEKTELRIVVDDETKKKLEEVRALLGPKGLDLGYAELMKEMADLAIRSLSEKRFGKKRVASKRDESEAHTSATRSGDEGRARVKQSPLPAKAAAKACQSRYLSAKTKHAVWKRDGGRCVRCQSQRNLNYDHVIPFAKGGSSEPENLRLLCFPCNQRASITHYGVNAARSWFGDAAGRNERH